MWELNNVKKRNVLCMLIVMILFVVCVCLV